MRRPIVVFDSVGLDVLVCLGLLYFRYGVFLSVLFVAWFRDTLMFRCVDFFSFFFFVFPLLFCIPLSSFCGHLVILLVYSDVA